MLPRASLLFLTFLCGAGFVVHANRPEPAPPRTNFESLPLRIERWTGQSLPPMDKQVLAILAADDLVNRVYFGPDRSMAGLFIGYYKSQRQGDAIHSPLNCLPGAGWEPMSKAYLTIPVSAAQGSTAISVNRTVIQKGLDRELVLYWYQSHGRVVASEYWSKLFLIRDAMTLNRTDAALVRVIVPIAPNIDDAEQQAERKGVDFVQQLFPILPKYLPS